MKTVIPDLEGITAALGDVFEFPDAERPYLNLARVYDKSGMTAARDAVMFLIGERFGRLDDKGSDPDEKQREHDREGD